MKYLREIFEYQPNPSSLPENIITPAGRRPSQIPCELPVPEEEDDPRKSIYVLI
jgi:hypothetical protein